jgi:enoyl-CoA hydratase
VADVGTLQRLPKLVGDQRARELSYTGRVFKGKEAEDMGLVLKCFPSKEDMMNFVSKTAETIAEKSPLTIRLIFLLFLLTCYLYNSYDLLRGVKKTLLYSRDHTVVDSLNQVRLRP